VRAPSEEKSDDSKEGFYENLEKIFFNHFPKYHMKILFGDFNAKVGEKIFSNQQSGMTVYIRIVMIMVLE
jgi:hypothetical protein